ncbi:GNAT family N-acetyltransferase [Pseudomonas wenzhouensis]|uniref:GNAT family N-acetyltransferase n=1 Tax=Pseudomonas wenzhouensis TaxID=2906062 RepID=UPI003B848DB6
MPLSMPAYRQLPSALRPLVDKFYREHRSSMRSQAGDELWVAQQGSTIVAALCLRPVADGQWLTGLFVAPAQRRQGLANALLAHSLKSHPQPIWLFCHPDLSVFYQRQGFHPCTQLPVELQQRLARYQRTKNLLTLRAH